LNVSFLLFLAQIFTLISQSHVSVEFSFASLAAVINFIQWQVTHEIVGQKVNQKKKKKTEIFHQRWNEGEPSVALLSYLGIGQALIIYLTHTLTVRAEVNRQLNSVQIDQEVS
jgi:hypothetical protein